MKVLVSLFLLGLFNQALLLEPSVIKLTAANDNFGHQLLAALESVEHEKSADSRSNVFISSYSVSSVLAILLAGGAEQTYDQIYNTLGFVATFDC